MQRWRYIRYIEPTVDDLVAVTIVVAVESVPIIIGPVTLRWTFDCGGIGGDCKHGHGGINPPVDVPVYPHAIIVIHIGFCCCPLRSWRLYAPTPRLHPHSTLAQTRRGGAGICDVTGF